MFLQNLRERAAGSQSSLLLRLMMRDSARFLILCLFCRKNETCTVNPEQRKLHLAECGRHHLVGSGWIIPNPGDSTTLQERQNNCLCRDTREEATPPAVPSSPDAPSQDPLFRTGLLAGQTPEESFRFFRPPASNFARDHTIRTRPFLPWSSG